MKKTCLTAMLLLAACDGKEEPKTQPEAPQAAPIRLDPNPPMSSADIDAIVDQQRGRKGAIQTDPQEKQGDK